MKVICMLSAALFVLCGYAQNQNCLKFDGIDDYVNLNSLQQDFYNNQNSFTIEFWMQASYQNQTSSIRTCMFSINEPTGQNRLLLIMGGNTTQDGLLMVYPDGSWGTNTAYTSVDTIGDGECHHIAYSYDGSTGRVYIDGVLMDSHSENYNFTLQDRYSLGQEYDNADTSQFYNGTIDDLRIWSVVRSDSEISNGMNTEISGTEPNLIAYYNFNHGIDSGNNLGLDSLVDQTGLNHQGQLKNFDLTNSTSNWVRSLCTNPFVGIEEFNTAVDFKIYPNPAVESFTISLNLEQSADVEIRMFDTFGKLIYHSDKGNLSAGNQMIQIYNDHLENGVYFVSVSLDTETFTKKLMILD